MRTNTIVKIQTDQSELIEQLQQENELLRGFIGQVSIDEINRLKEVEKQLAVCQAQLTEKDKSLADLKSETEKRVKLARESAERQGELQRQQSLKDKEHNMKSKVIKPLKEANKKLETENKELKVSNEDLMHRLEEMHQLIQDFRAENKSMLEQVLDILASSSSTEEASIKIKNLKPDKSSGRTIEEECNIIHDMLQQGYEKQDIATYLWPETSRRKQKITERLKSKYYISKYGEE